MSGIDRRPEIAARRAYDLIVVGGGIHGATMVLEAARRGLRPLLIERSDFGGATSASSLKILHGGLRYLQSLDLPRFYESVAERRWYSREFPDLVRPLPCVMPLYGKGLRRPSVMRAALKFNDALSSTRNRGVPASARLPRSRVLDVIQTKRLFPGVDATGLQGAALWYDAIMTSSERVLIEILHWAMAVGGTALNYVEAVGLEVEEDGTLAVTTVDHETGSRPVFRAGVVINCAGPWAPDVAEALDQAEPGLFPPSLAFNILLDRDPISEAAVAVEPPGGGRTYFVVPWKGRILAGTCHVPWSSGPDSPLPTAQQVASMLEDINRAIPDLNCDVTMVSRVLAGLMPTTGPGHAGPASRGRLVDHGRQGGPPGLYTVVGVKYTTARAVAERTLQQVFGRRSIRPRSDRPRPSLVAQAMEVEASERTWSMIIDQESVLHLDDLLLRRMEWDPRRAAPASALRALTRMFGWNRSRQEQELKRFQDSILQSTEPLSGTGKE